MSIFPKTTKALKELRKSAKSAKELRKNIRLYLILYKKHKIIDFWYLVYNVSEKINLKAFLKINKLIREEIPK